MAGGTAMQIGENQDYAGALMDNAATSLKIGNEARYNQETENNQKAALDALEVQRATMRRIATAEVSAGEAGVGGNSVLRDFMVSEMQGAHDAGVIETTRSNANKQVRLDAKAARAQYDSQIDQAKNIAGNPLGNALQIGTAGVSGYVGAGGKFK